MKEIWKEIKNYEMYEVSNLGNFRSKFVRKENEKYREIKGTLSSSGYQNIFLTGKNGKKVSCKAHRLVAEAFIENPEKKRTVNHINGHKLDNRLSNLEWMTHSENNLHAHKTGLINNKKSYTNSEKLEMIEMYNNKERATDICIKYNIHNTTLYRILRQKGIKFNSRNSCYVHSFSERKKLKEIIFSSNKSNKKLSEELLISEKLIGEIKTSKKWEDIKLDIDPEFKATTSKYSYEERIKLKEIIIKNIEMKNELLSEITGLSIKTISKIKRNLIWTEIKI